MIEINWGELTFEGFLSFILDESTAYQFCLQFGVVDREVTCECGNVMRLQINQQKANGMVFACTSMRSVCRKQSRHCLDIFFIARDWISVLPLNALLATQQTFLGSSYRFILAFDPILLSRIGEHIFVVFAVERLKTNCIIR